MVSSAAMNMPLTLNRGDRIAKEPQTLEEKAKQIAVDKYDITGVHIKVPAYFVVTYPNGETKALHHIKDAQAISDVIRQMRLQEEETPSNTTEGHSLNGFLGVLGLSFLMLLLMTAAITIGVF